MESDILYYILFRKSVYQILTSGVSFLFNIINQLKGGKVSSGNEKKEYYGKRKN